MMHRLSQLILVWTIKRVVVSHSITLFQTQQILTMCQMCCFCHVWDQHSIGQLRTVVRRRCLGCHMMHKARQLILVGTTPSVAVSHCLTCFQTQLLLTACHIRCHSDLWDHWSIGQLRTLVPRGCLRYHIVVARIGALGGLRGL